MESRIDELEAKLALAEDLLETLNLTVYRQQAQIELLQQQLRRIAEQLPSGAGFERSPPADEVPPHY